MDSNSSGHQAGPIDMVTQWLRCPTCRATPLLRAERSVVCRSGHSFDVASHGYLSLITGHRPHRGDDAAMVAAREQFLGRDHYRPLRSTVTALAIEYAPADPRLVIDLAGGTGHYLASVIEARAASLGLTVDISTAALRRAARAHTRVAAVGADVWQPLPVVSGAAGVVLSIFGPRNVTEIERLLAEDGVVVLAHAAPDHLRELRHLVGTIGVDPHKSERLASAFGSFDRPATQTVTWRLALTRADVELLVAMGPSARHVDGAQLRRSTDRLPELIGVTAAMEVLVLRR